MVGSLARVLIVGPDPRATDQMRSTLASRFACEVVPSGETGLAAFGSQPFDVVVANDPLQGMSGLELLDNVRMQSPETAFILVGDVQEAGLSAGLAAAIEAGKRGAYDYIVGPVDDGRLLGCVERAFAQVERRSNRGATGTGKDVLAARIHARGPRRHRPFVVIDASAIAAHLLDSELFGHVAGAFTGATRARKGLIAEAEGGTVLLDGIADLPIEQQGRLLRVMESSAVRSVGEDHEHRVDVRFIATTHSDLSDAVRARTFREDLYFRLDVLSIHVPPLRERREDLPALIEYFFDRARARNPRSPVNEIAPAAHRRLVEAEWPGNVRELQGFLERLVVLGKAPRVELSDLDLRRELGSLVGGPQSSGKLSSLREMSTRHVEAVLVSTNGDKARAAAILGVDVSTLYRWQRRPPASG
jgi:two-component system response regulator HydG